MEASLGALVDCLRAVTRPYPDMPSIDVRRAYLAYCAPSPWLLVLVLASTGVCTLASQHALPSVLAGFGAAALVWFHSDGPGRLNHLGSPAALALIGLAAWWATHPASGTALHLLIIAAAVLVIALAALRLRTVLHMAMRLQARVDATTMAARWIKLPAAVSALAVQQLLSKDPMQPSLHRTLVLATLAWAANEEAQAMERRR